MVDIPVNKGPELPKEIDWSDMNKSFFDAVFPSIKGHGKIIDEYLMDGRAEYHRTMIADRI